VYDLSADEDSQVQVNIEGTRNVVEFAKAVDAGHVHHVSSIAAAGLYEGVFREDMFDEAEGLDHPYFMTKHESEKIVRKECKVPWTVYRPAMVVGDSDHRRDGQDRRPVLLLQADPAHAAVSAAVDAVGGPGRRAHQHRAGGLRRQGARPHQPQQACAPAASASTWWTRRATASATCSTSSARPRTRRR
jgi:nucleoside-diphosphate-sugar epimerase